jgi:hypothetical protein
MRQSRMDFVILMAQSFYDHIVNLLNGYSRYIYLLFRNINIYISKRLVNEQERTIQRIEPPSIEKK